MPESITLSYSIDPTWEPGVRVELEIDGVVQPDLIRPTSGRDDLVMGSQELGDFMLGSSTSEALGDGRLGDGCLGLGTPLIEHRTLNRFPAGDLNVRLRTLDRIGNASDWSAPRIIEHRPPPNPPTNFKLNADGSALAWNWA